MVHLLCVGHASVDHSFELPSIPSAAPAKTAASAYRRGVGGMSANAAWAATRLGARVRFASVIGDDENGDLIVRHLDQVGIDARGLRRVAGASSSVSTVLIDARGERLIVTLRGDALTRPPAFDASLLDGVDVLLTDPRCAAYAAAALVAARGRGLPSVLDADVAPRDDLRRLVALADWVVFSEPGLGAFSDAPLEAALREAIGLGAAACAVTRGERGVLWLDDGVLRESPAFAVTPVVDTTGAGDVFHAAFALALAERQSVRAALRFSAAAAALKCLRPHGVRFAPTRAEVERLLAAAEPSS